MKVKIQTKRDPELEKAQAKELLIQEILNLSATDKDDIEVLKNKWNTLLQILAASL